MVTLSQKQQEIPFKKQGDIHLTPERDSLLTQAGKSLLVDRYLLPDESFQDLFRRVALSFSDDQAHAQRLYTYMSQLWFMPATPILSNAGTTRGLPISCYLNEVSDSLEGIVESWNENTWLAARGGGIGTYWGNIRSIGEKVSVNGKTSGIVPFVRVLDSLMLAIDQGSLRRANAAMYLPISHPEIEEFIEIRKPTGGDHNRKTPNLHHGVLISDAFMEAVEKDQIWRLRSPKTQEVIREVSARDLWARLLTARVETGEPYLVFIDTVNRAIPKHHELSGLRVKMSNLCSEITLPTGIDHLGNQRTAICCLSSLNLETYEQWKDQEGFLDDIMRFLDNVLNFYIKNAPDTMKNAKYSAMRERSVGLGVMGFHSFLQQKNIPMESVMAKVWNKKIFSMIHENVNRISYDLAKERGPCLDAAEHGIMERFSNKTAIAPTASISMICGGASPGIEPIAANAYVHKTLSGSFSIRNRYLETLLKKKGADTEENWTSITVHGGSVQHLDCLDDHEKAVFKTAFELDQQWLIEHAADRTPYISQSQSLNLFVPANIHKRDLHRLHFNAWKKGVKSMYYNRSQSLQRAEVVSFPGRNKVTEASAASNAAEETKYEECLACQ